jgi:hypothetical protein
MNIISLSDISLCYTGEEKVGSLVAVNASSSASGLRSRGDELPPNPRYIPSNTPGPSSESTIKSKTGLDPVRRSDVGPIIPTSESLLSGDDGCDNNEGFRFCRRDKVVKERGCDFDSNRGSGTGGCPIADASG